MSRVVLAGLLCGGSTAAQEPGSASLSLALNIPAYRLDAWQDGRVVMTIPVAVGSARYPTPNGRFAITVITWNPWWFPPDRAWAARDTITPPCPQNPVGRVKLAFAPLYFVHGTPQERSIGSAASHGCVRTRQDDALALAALIVSRMLPDSAAAAAAYAAGTETRSMRLPEPVALEIRYALAEVRGDSLWMYPDPYRKARTIEARVRAALAALAAAGCDTLAMSPASLRRLARDSRRRPAALPLHDGPRSSIPSNRK